MGIDSEKKAFAGWWLWVVGLILLSSVVFWIFGGFGLIGRTVLEREVFERSYQYSEARKVEIATYEAQLAELEAQKANPDLDAGTRAQIDAQIRAIRVQLRVAKERQ